jgi:hypothetical protein
MHLSIYFTIPSFQPYAFLGSFNYLSLDQLPFKDKNKIKSSYLTSNSCLILILQIPILIYTCFLRTARLLVCIEDWGKTPLEGGRPISTQSKVWNCDSKQSISFVGIINMSENNQLYTRYLKAWMQFYSPYFVSFMVLVPPFLNPRIWYPQFLQQQSHTPCTNNLR